MIAELLALTTVLVFANDRNIRSGSIIGVVLVGVIITSKAGIHCPTVVSGM